MANRVVKITLGTVVVLVATAFIGLFFWFGYHRSITFADAARDRAKLIDGIEAYWSIKDLENHLRKNLLTWELEQGQPPAADDWRPPFVVDTVKIKNYLHSGLTGELHVELFNNRVVSTLFFPHEFDRYLAQLAKTERADPIHYPEIKLSRYTRIWRAEAGREKRRYVGWEDVRLSEEMSIWVKRYS